MAMTVYENENPVVQKAYREKCAKWGRDLADELLRRSPLLVLLRYIHRTESHSRKDDDNT